VIVLTLGGGFDGGGDCRAARRAVGCMAASECVAALIIASGACVGAIRFDARGAEGFVGSVSSVLGAAMWFRLKRASSPPGGNTTCLEVCLLVDSPIGDSECASIGSVAAGIAKIRSKAKTCRNVSRIPRRKPHTLFTSCFKSCRIPHPAISHI
jgi:hypothetical protein